MYVGKGGDVVVISSNNSNTPNRLSSLDNSIVYTYSIYIYKEKLYLFQCGDYLEWSVLVYDKRGRRQPFKWSALACDVYYNQLAILQRSHLHTT